jgi:hypothetical protein
MPLDLHEVSGLPETLAELRAEIEAVRTANGDGWLRGSERIGAYIGLDGASVRRRLRTDAELRKVIAREGRDLVAEKSKLDAYMRRNGQ